MNTSGEDDDVEVPVEMYQLPEMEGIQLENLDKILHDPQQLRKITRRWLSQQSPTPNGWTDVTKMDKITAIVHHELEQFSWYWENRIHCMMT